MSEQPSSRGTVFSEGDVEYTQLICSLLQTAGGNPTNRHEAAPLGGRRFPEGRGTVPLNHPFEQDLSNPVL